MLHRLIYSQVNEVNGKWYWKSQSKENNTGYICYEKWGNVSYFGSIFDVTLSGPPGIVIY
jgi:hypothetical protein